MAKSTTQNKNHKFAAEKLINSVMNRGRGIAIYHEQRAVSMTIKTNRLATLLRTNIESSSDFDEFRLLLENAFKATTKNELSLRKSNNFTARVLGFKNHDHYIRSCVKRAQAPHYVRMLEETKSIYDRIEKSLTKNFKLNIAEEFEDLDRNYFYLGEQFYFSRAYDEDVGELNHLPTADEEKALLPFLGFLNTPKAIKELTEDCEEKHWLDQGQPEYYRRASLFDIIMEAKDKLGWPIKTKTELCFLEEEALYRHNIVTGESIITVHDERINPVTVLTNFERQLECLEAWSICPGFVYNYENYFYSKLTSGSIDDVRSLAEVIELTEHKTLKLKLTPKTKR